MLANSKNYFKKFLKFIEINKRVAFRELFLKNLKKAFLIIDFFFFFTKYFKTNNLYKRINFRVNFNQKNIQKHFDIKYESLKSFFGLLQHWWLALIVFTFIIYFMYFLKTASFNKIFFSWLSVVMLIYWLLSGFVFFVKKYQYGKYTTAIQRFWRRSYIIFWLIEGSVFSVFIYLTLNASNDSFYSFDNSFIYNSHLFSWRLFIFKLLPLTFLICYSYLYLLALKWNIFSKQSVYMYSITMVLTYVVLIEIYQFYHVINYYSGLIWTYDIQSHVWILDTEQRRTRLLNNYTVLLLILKFWHIVFIYVFWLFLILRGIENTKVTYPLLSAAYQNFLILYIFAWIFMYPWVKFYLRKLLDFNYQSFYVTKKNWQVVHVVFDLKLFFFGLRECIYNICLPTFKNFLFFYWMQLTIGFKCYSNRNEFVKLTILNSLN